MEKKISVIMSSYRENENWLRQAIESVLKQTYRNLELIIMLDDPTNELHKTVIREYEKTDSRIRFFVNEKNLGLVGSLNRALQYAEGEYIARMDADDVSVSDRLECQCKELEEKGLDMLGSYLRAINEEQEEIYVYDNLPLNFKEVEKKIIYNNCVPHPAWLARRSVYDVLAGYRQIPLCEDYDFILRAIEKGFKVGNLNKICLLYRMTKQSLSRSNLLKQYLVSRYLVECYRKKREYCPEEVEQILTKRCTERSNKHYNRSNLNFNNGLDALKNKKYGKSMLFMIQAFFGSRYFAGKMLGFVRAAI